MKLIIESVYPRVPCSIHGSHFFVYFYRPFYAHLIPFPRLIYRRCLSCIGHSMPAEQMITCPNIFFRRVQKTAIWAALFHRQIPETDMRHAMYNFIYKITIYRYTCTIQLLHIQLCILQPLLAPSSQNPSKPPNGPLLHFLLLLSTLSTPKRTPLNLCINPSLTGHTILRFSRYR